ncbi:MAG: sugar ABC transporter ATP-binding protein [Actinobacteria bacterium]|nr:sugar ABC transporter ATP-binding protein [Actinomycetota bacterium]
MSDPTGEKAPEPAIPDGTSVGVAETPYFLEGIQLHKQYPGVLAVDHVDIGMRPGEVLGLVGKNGAGKSTTIKMFAGAVAPDAGEIRLDGKTIHLHGPHHAHSLGLSFVHQELSDVPNLSVAENVMLGLGYPRRLGAFVSWRRLRQQAAEVLARIDAPIRPDALVGSLSVVQQRLVMIAHALARESRLLVLDEPTASLTNDEIEHLFAVVRSLATNGVSVVYVSHRLDEIFEITQRVVVMRDARVVANVPTAELDRRSLIAQITGTTSGQTAAERRAANGVGPPPETDVLLEVENVTLPGLVDSVSFQLREGELLGIAGLVGAGRTELVRLITGADRRASGRIAIRGRDIGSTTSSALDAGIVLVPEERRTQGLVLEFSIRKNVTLATLPQHRLAGVLPSPSVTQERKTAHAMIERLAIRASGSEQPAGWLSGGNQQKVVLAKWLRRGGDVFVLDEPTLGIDVEAKEEIYDLMEALTADDKGVIFISSEFPELVGICNRVIVLREGRIVGQLVGDEITESGILDLCYSHAADEAAPG